MESKGTTAVLDLTYTIRGSTGGTTRAVTAEYEKATAEPPAGATHRLPRATPSPRSDMELLWKNDVAVKARTGKVRLSVSMM